MTPRNELIFVEVKTTLRPPEEAWGRVDPAKEGRLNATAREYLLAHGLNPEHPARFDVILIEGDPRRLRGKLLFSWAQGVF